jgi:hypothetical protein
MFSDNVRPNKYYNYVEEVELNGEIEKIGQYAFGRMASLGKINLPVSLVTIDSAAFTTCNFVEISLPERLQTIGGYCFESNKFESLTIPSSVTTIGSCCFQSNKSLKNVYFKGKPTSISTSTFDGCSAFDLYVPWAEGEVANAPWGASLTTIHYNTQYDADGNPITT